MYSLHQFNKLMPIYIAENETDREVGALFELRGGLSPNMEEDLLECIDKDAWHKALRKAARRGLKVELLEEFLSDYKAATGR